MGNRQSDVLLGAHLSIAGGVDQALVRAGELGFEVLAMFLRNQRQWSAAPLTAESVRAFRRLRRTLRIKTIVAHGSYLLNLAGSGEVYDRSLAALADELDRCDRLGIECLVIHPGSCEGAGVGEARVAGAVRTLLARGGRVRLLLETTAGQGSCVGWRFEHLGEIIRQAGRPARLGVCLDTAHVFAAGYDIDSPDGYEAMWEQFDRAVGLRRLRAVHVNDSLRPRGSRVDRHAHIGHGRIGLETFRRLVNDPRLARVPLILETPKGVDDQGRDWDAVNAQTLRDLRVGGP